MNEPLPNRLLILTDESVEDQGSLGFLSAFFVKKGYEVITHDLHQIREREIDLGEIIRFSEAQTILYHLNDLRRLEEFRNFERLKPSSTRLIIFSPQDEGMINKAFQALGDGRKREIVPMPFVDIDELVRIVVNEGQLRGKERE